MKEFHRLPNPWEHTVFDEDRAYDYTHTYAVYLFDEYPKGAEPVWMLCQHDHNDSWCLVTNLPLALDAPVKDVIRAAENYLRRNKHYEVTGGLGRQ